MLVTPGRKQSGVDAGLTVYFFELIYGRGLDDIEDRDDLWIRSINMTVLSHTGKQRTFSLTPHSLRNLSSLSSRRVRKQNMEWSKGAIFLIATFLPLGLWMAEQTMP
jgi:hypothetical protein